MWPKSSCLATKATIFQSTHPWRMWLSPASSSIAIIFQSTHPWRMWLASKTASISGLFISIHTSVKDVTQIQKTKRSDNYISIHTSVKDVTKKSLQSELRATNFNPHIREGCDTLKKNTHICSARSLCSTNRFLPNLFLSSSLRLTMLKALFQRQRNGSVHFMFDCNCQESV